MANARKLPSGAWRTLASKMIGNKKVRKSFTVHPNETGGDSRKAKALSEMQAREWQFSTVSTEVYGLKIREAMTGYIEDRSKVLSPSTITNYKRLLPYFDSIMDIYVDDIETPQIQRIINDMSISVKAKTIKNRISFLFSALDYAGCEKKFKVRYPQSESKTILSPDTEDVQMMIEAAPDDFKPVLYLAAFGGLRRGEISALKQKDISRDMNTVHVHADMVLDGHKWKYKAFTKNSISGVVQLPKFAIEALPVSDDPEAYVFNFNPNMITHRFDNLKKVTQLPFNFHSLRHFAASFRSDLNIPSKYIEEMGRWKNSKVLKQVYDNALSSSRKKYTKIANDYLEEKFNQKKTV